MEEINHLMTIYIDVLKDCAKFVKDLYQKHGKDPNYLTEQYRKDFLPWYEKHLTKDPAIDHFLTTIYFIGQEIFSTTAQCRANRTAKDILIGSITQSDSLVFASFIVDRDIRPNYRLGGVCEEYGQT